MRLSIIVYYIRLSIIVFCWAIQQKSIAGEELEKMVPKCHLTNGSDTIKTDLIETLPIFLNQCIQFEVTIYFRRISIYSEN